MSAVSFSRGIFVVSAKRTPVGALNGKLKDLTPVDLQVHASKAAIDAAKIDPKFVDSVVIGNVHSSTSACTPYLARFVGRRVGLPEHVPAYVVNRLCASGFQSIACGMQEISVGQAEVVLTGGVESMSKVPFMIRNIREGIRLGGEPKLEDFLWVTLADHLANAPMGITAENLAEKYKVTREECDKYALQSQTRWASANQAGYFKEEISPIAIKVKGKEEVLDYDEPPRQTSLEKLAKLPAVFKKNGTVTAGNASGISDGASAIVIASEEAVKKHNLKPIARILGYSVVGVDPLIMGIGPAPAIRLLLDKTGKKLNDISILEVNEAFAAQYLSVEKELGLDQSITNTNGGAIALGHPLGMSGNRISGHVIHELRRKGQKYGISSACVGGGQGMAVLFESIK